MNIKKILPRLLFPINSQNVILFNNNYTMFYVNLDKLKVGTLIYSNNVWYFTYSNEFKNQSRILPLVNFPSKDKEYSTRELWPFFTSRIPSNAQLQINKSNKQENIVVQLQKFGRRTITNPFELCIVAK